MTLSHLSSARTMLDALESRTISARELLDLHFKRHNDTHTKINAVIRVDLESAQRAAATIDNARARGEQLGPLAGLPMTVKDCFDVRGLPAVCGNPDWTTRSSDCEDAEVIARVRRAGAVIWGKTNVPQMLQGWQSANPIYGATSNPYDTSRTPGGSSGGSAAALAAGVTPLEIGSDIGGSLRVPAHYCGVTACKPTWGVVPQGGHLIRPPEFDQEIDLNVVGPMARNISDLALMLGVLTNGSLAPTRARNRPLKATIWTDGFSVGRWSRKAVGDAAEMLRLAGMEISHKSPPPNLNALLVAYRDLLLDALSYPGSPRPQISGALRPLFHLQRALGAGPLSMAGYGLAFTGGTRQIARASAVRNQLKQEMRAFFCGQDLLICPPAPSEAFPHDQNTPLHVANIDLDGQQIPMLHHLQWASLASALHLPAVVVPVGLGKSGLPIGVQIIAGWGDEATLLEVAKTIEAARGPFPAPPIDARNPPNLEHDTDVVSAMHAQAISQHSPSSGSHSIGY